MTDTLLSDIVIKERPPQETNKNSPFLAKKGQCLSILFFFEEEENNNNKKMGPTVIDTNPAVNCGNSLTPYRSQDGSCNNIRHPNWGRANIALTRLLPPEYEDGK